MLSSHTAWAGLFLSSFAIAAPFVETKDVVKVDALQKKDIIIEAGSGDVNIYINQVVATTTVAATTVTVPGCGGATPVTATQIAAPPYAVVNTVPAGGNPSALPKPGTYDTGSTSWSAEQGPYDGKEPEAVLHPVDPKLPAYAHPSACAPQPAATLYYGQSTTAPGQPVASAAILEIPSLNYPAVNAHLAEAIVSVVCRGGSATVTFSNSAAYDVAVNTWTQPLTLISYSDSCGTGKDGTHDFILIQKVNKGPSGSLTLECAITIIDFEEAVGADTEMTCTIGAHNPGYSNNGTIPGTNPGTNGTIPGGNGNANGTTATCLAAGFDEALDEAKGDDINIADPSVWDKIAPGTDAEDWGGDFEIDELPDVDENETRARRRKRSLRRRSALRSRSAALKKRGLKEWAKKKYNNFAKNNPIVRLPTTDEVGDFLERKARQALGVLNDWTSVNKDLSSDLSFNRYPTNGQSPFNDNAAGYKFYDNGDLEAWCVGCGADSTLRTTGKITFSIAKGFSNGNVRLFGGFNAGLNVGLIGKVAKNIPIAETTFVQVTLGDVLLPGILKLGPSVRVGAGSFVVFEATGQLYTGVNARWPNVDISLDALNIGASYANGLTPEITTKFETKGEISITVDTHLTLAVGLTIGILNDKFTRSVEVIDQPGLQVTAGIQGSASFNGGFSAGFEGECRGISLAAKVYNNVTADILKITQRQLFQWTSPTVSRCFTIGGSNPTNPEPSTTPTTPDEPSTTPTDPDTPAPEDGGDSAAPAPEGKRRRDLKKSARAPKVSVDGRKRSPYLAPRQVAPSNATGDVFLNTTRPSKENEGESFTPMASNDGFFELHWSEEGNIYVLPSNEDTDSVGAAADDTSINSADETGLFGTLQVDNSTAKIIIGDSDGRLFTAYSDEFAKYGVSRIRLHEPDFLPATALSVAFGDANDSNTQGTDSDALVASDTAENIYYPVVCVYDECYPKLFLVKDPYDGPGLLKNLPELTGQDNLDCGFLPLVPQIY